MVEPLPTPLSEVYYFWSLLLLPSSLVLNLSAFFLILRSAGSCYKDPIVPPLLSLLGETPLRLHKQTKVSDPPTHTSVPMFQEAISSTVFWFKFSLSTSKAMGHSYLLIHCVKSSKSTRPSCRTCLSPPSASNLLFP